ncbi:MAG: hypothetical protein WKF66_20185 [Pedobacter sp.]
MKNLLYLLFLALVITSCGKRTPAPDTVDNYKRVTSELKQVLHVMSAGSKPDIFLYMDFPKSTVGKASKIIGYDVYSEGAQIYTATGLNIGSEDINNGAYIYGFKTNVLKEGWNIFNYTINYEDGFKQNASGKFYALKDKKIGTWWEKITFAYLDTVPVTMPFIDRISDPSQMRPATINSYFSKPPQLDLIDGLCGVYYVVFDNQKHLQTIFVSHGYTYNLNAGVIKDDILKVYPDFSVTKTGHQSYVLNNPAFNFRVYFDGKSYFTEIKKNN